MDDYLEENLIDDGIRRFLTPAYGYLVAAQHLAASSTALVLIRVQMHGPGNQSQPQVTGPGDFAPQPS